MKASFFNVYLLKKENQQKKKKKFPQKIFFFRYFKGQDQCRNNLRKEIEILFSVYNQINKRKRKIEECPASCG